MKKILCVLGVLLIISCKNGQEESAVKSADPIKEEMTNSVSFDWLLGSWKRSNDEEGKQTFERWEKRTDEHYIGLGYTMESDKIIWSESIALIKKGDQWSFDVMAQGDTVSTDFALTDIAPSEFTCINNENEFPNKIIYNAIEDGLHAVIYGGGKEIAFDFERIK